MARLPCTFPSPATDSAIFAAWKDWSGRWKPTKAGPLSEVLLAPRLPRRGIAEPTGTLSGFVEDGDYEGVLHFPAPGKGIFVRAHESLEQLDATLVAGPPNKATLTIGARDFQLERIGAADHDILAQVIVIGHQGLTFGDLGNHVEAFAAAWLFGASGIELDVSIPFKLLPDYAGHAVPTLMPDQLFVVHPPTNDNMIEIGATTGYLPAIQMFPQLGSFGVPFFYVDAKVAGPEVAAVREDVLCRLILLSKQAIDAAPGLQVSIAAVTTESSKYLGGESASAPDWTLEWVTTENALDAATKSTVPPSVLSFDLDGVTGLGTWPIDWIFPDIKPAEEKAIRDMPQPLVFFTADSPAEYAGILDVLTDPKRFGRKLQDGDAGIIADLPHRLVHWLATP